MRCLNCQSVHNDSEIELEDGCCPSCGSTMFDTGLEHDDQDEFFDDDLDFEEEDLKEFLDDDFFNGVDYDDVEFDEEDDPPWDDEDEEDE